MSQQSEQPEINPSAVTISTLGFVAALITSFMNINLVKNYTRISVRMEELQNYSDVPLKQF
ncbi:Protein CBG10512 [Caenorhabditis briggsae]|uniref:Protein CBG10512 n=1 Tax=Caenorhabditis briggsae TaxID=6238 RepID=A8XAZ3_CAEBR|nr:Protein CBG10512 [Caenorhabditis briggsae]CAP29921.2 Protein CBG10512 [Caenorhabditis briggsae]